MTLPEIIKLIYEKTIPELNELRVKGFDFTVIDPYDQNNGLIAYSGYGYSHKYEQAEMVDFLLSCGLDINHQKNKRDYQLSALHMAVANHHSKIIEALIERGASIEIQDLTGNTPLFNTISEYRGQYEIMEIIELLLRSGASIDIKNNKNNSARDLIERTGRGIDEGLNPNSWDLRSILD